MRERLEALARPLRENGDGRRDGGTLRLLTSIGIKWMQLGL